MSVVKRRGIGAAVIVLVAAGAVAGLVVTAGERPVDVRLVAPKPAQQETVSASMTTTVPAIAAQTTTVPSATQPVAVPAGTPTPAPRPKAPNKAGLPNLIGGLCRHLYLDAKGEEQCLQWDQVMQDPCRWLAEQGLKEIKVRGRDRHDLDLDRQLKSFSCSQQGKP